MPHGGPHKLSQRQIVCSIVPEDDMSPSWGEFLFAQVSGGEITAAVEKVYAGGDQFPTVLCAPYEIGDITVTAHMDSWSQGRRYPVKLKRRVSTNKRTPTNQLNSRGGL